MEVKVTVVLDERREVHNVSVRIPESELEYIADRLIDLIRARARRAGA